MKRDNEERSSSRALGDHGEEFGVNGTEVVVMDAVSDGNSLVTLFPASRFSIKHAGTWSFCTWSATTSTNKTQREITGYTD